jgi:phage tail sheath protein FI
MANMKRPGVYVSETLLFTNPDAGSPEATGAFLGTAAKGDNTAPGLVSSWDDFVTMYGGFPSSGAISELAYGVYSFFANGGRQAYVQRVTGTGAQIATVVLTDRAATPQSTLTVSAKSSGAWGNSLRIGIVDRDAPGGRYDLLVYNGGTTDPYVVERWIDVSSSPSDGRYVVNLVNSATAGSSFITLTEMSSATAAPNNSPAVATTALSSGADGSAPNTAQMQAAVSLFDAVPYPLVINVPGVTTAAIINTVITYAENRGDVFVVCDTPSGQDVAGAVSYAASLSPLSSYAAVYYPWVQMVDPTQSGGSSTRLSAPGAAIVGLVCATDAARGPMKAPAGVTARLSGAVALERKLTDTDLDTLNTSHINAVRNVPGSGICVMGARTLKKTSIDRYIPARRSLIYLKAALKNATQFAVFEPNDPTLWSTLTTRCIRVLADFWTLGGLKGNAAEAYYVKCDGTNNTPSSIANGVVNIEVGVALRSPAEFIVIKLGQWESGSTSTNEVIP